MSGWYGRPNKRGGSAVGKFTGLLAFGVACLAVPALAQSSLTPEQMAAARAKMYAEVEKQKAALKALEVDPLTPDEVVAAARASGAAEGTKVVATMKVGASILPPGTGRVAIYHAYAVTDSGASFSQIKDPHDYPLPAIFIFFDTAKPDTDYLLDCRFSSPDGPSVQIGYKIYDDVHEIHPDSQETTQKGHMTGLFHTGTAGGVTAHLSLDGMNIKSAYYRGCEIYELWH